MRIIRNYDVASYYPHLMVLPLNDGWEYGYCSRNIPSPQIYKDTLEERIRAKKAGDTASANALKLVLNTTYGCMKNGKGTEAYNDLYDPLMARSVCISGQLLLLELAEHLYRDIPEMKVVSCNTDGLMIEFDDSQYEAVMVIINEWQERTGFELEEDKITKLIQANVNNYIEVYEDGKVKTKGGMLVRGIAPEGAFNINNNMPICSKAIVDYFVDGKSPADTINKCDDILSFQIISKVGGLYSECVYEHNGEMVQVQKVNRVYATDDVNCGTLYKRSIRTGNLEKVASLPQHCLVDNKNELDISQIDKNWYIKYTKGKIGDIKGIKPKKVNKREVNKMLKACLKALEN